MGDDQTQRARPETVTLQRLAAQVELAPEETLRLVWRGKVAVRVGVVHLDASPDGPRHYQVEAGGRTVSSGKGCSVDMYLVALALGKPIHTRATCPATGTTITVDITPERVERIDPSTAVVAVTTLDVDLAGGPDDTDAEVCSQQPFFATAEAAADWLATHPQGRLIPVRDFHTPKPATWSSGSSGASPQRPHGMVLDSHPGGQTVRSRPNAVEEARP